MEGTGGPAPFAGSVPFTWERIDPKRMREDEERGGEPGGRGSARAMFAEAVSRHRTGQAGEAERLYRRVLALDPRHADSLHLLGVLAYDARRYDDAVALIERAIELRRDVPTYHNNLGLACRAQGRIADAIACFERALSLRPHFALAQNNLGVALLSEKRLDDAVAHFDQALAVEPNHVSARVNLGTALTEQGKFDAAEAQFRRALAVEPRSADAHYNLGVALMWQNRVDEAFSAYRRAAELRFGARAAAVAGGPVPPYKAKHDREQFDYLLTARSENEQVGRLRGAVAREPERFAELFDRLYHLEDGARCDDAVNSKIDFAAIEARWEGSHPKLVVVDEFLAPAALDELRRFCWGSTVWRKAYANGYLGAFFADGFACPLLAQIAADLAAKLPGIIRKRPLRQLWGFKYDTERHGIAVHADEAAVNVNFWITADEANLDADSGGLVIWDVPAPLDWAFAKYQNNDSSDIRAFLETQRATSIRVPYRANRAVIFDSDLFHETDRFAFRDGYLQRRINITMLYGSRHDAGEG
jgi:tetratricopeptide (TPR) repeat protein